MWPELKSGRHQKSWQLGPCCLFLRQGPGRGVCTLLGLSPSQGWVVQRCLSPLPETKSLLACSSRRNYTLLVLPSSHPQQRASPVALATGHLPPWWFEASPLFSKGTRMMGRGDEGLECSMKSTKLRCSGLVLEAWQGTNGGDQAGAARCGPTCRQRASSGGFKPATLSLAALRPGSQRSTLRAHGGCRGGVALSLLRSPSREGLAQCSRVCSSFASHVQQMLISWSQAGYWHVGAPPKGDGGIFRISVSGKGSEGAPG